MLATMSVLGLYQYDEGLFDEMALPDGLELDVAIPLIIAESANMPVLYPNPVLFKQMLKAWNKRKLPIWKRLYDTTKLDYNPIENYDRIEEWEETTASNVSGSNTSGETYSDSRNDSGNNNQKRAAFNSTTLETIEGGDYVDTVDTSGERNANASNQTNASGTSRRSGRSHGNIGVTTSQQMIEAERDVSTFDIYSVIVSDFVDAFCVQIYV